jgi:hypothetical protein
MSAMQLKGIHLWPKHSESSNILQSFTIPPTLGLVSNSIVTIVSFKEVLGTHMVAYPPWAHSIF